MWRQTWRKNWVNCAILTGNKAGLRTALSCRLSHTELCSSLRESHSFLSLPADTTMASCSLYNLQHPFLAIHSADEHRMIYSFSNTTSYCTFNAFFSSFRITLRPMWLANESLVFIHNSHTHKNTHRTDQKNWQTWWETCVVPESIQFNFSCSSFTQLNCTV